MPVEQMFPQASERLATIGAAVSVTDAAEVASSLRADLVVVCNETGSMVGVITKTDIVSQTGRSGAHGRPASVGTIMTREVFSCRANEWLQDVWTSIKSAARGVFLYSERTASPSAFFIRAMPFRACLAKWSEETLLLDYVMNVGYR